MGLKEALKQGLEFFSNRDNWCSGVTARDKHLNQVNHQDPDAVRFCSTGYVERFLARVDDKVDTQKKQEIFVALLAENMGNLSDNENEVATTNDEGYQETLDMWKQAYERNK